MLPGDHSWAAMNRTDLQILAEMRVVEAQALLDAGCWAGAYYLLGYAVECALKACAAKEFRQDEVPEKKRVNDFYTHRLDQLLEVAGLKPALGARAAVERAFRVNWNIVRDWDESSRYDHTISESTARVMRDAVIDATTGVLPWLKTMW
jgi:hypothetical protein